jgi:hypothetical protein
MGNELGDKNLPRTSRVKTPSPVTIQLGTTEQPAQIEPTPPAAQEERPPTWFWDKLAAIPLEEWRRGIYEVWLSRGGDTKVPMASGEKGYLDTFVEPFTSETVKQKYGGGKYIAVLNKNGRFVTTHNFEIVGTPIYDARRERPVQSPAVAAVAPDTTSIVNQVVSILREELTHARESGNGSSAANDAVVTMMSNAASKAVETVANQLPQKGNPTSEMRELLGAMKEMGIIGQAQSGSAVGNLVKELLPLITLLSPLLGKFFTPNDPLAQITSLQGVLEKLDALRGGTGGKTDTNSLILAGIEKLPEVIAQMGAQKQASAQIAQAQAERAQHQRATVERLQTLPAATPPGVATPQHAAPQRSGAGVGTPGAVPTSGPIAVTPLDRGVSAEVGAPTNQPDAQYSVDQWLKEQIYNMVALGLNGEKIAEFIDTMKPELLADLARYDAATIEQFFQLDPIMAEVVKLPNWPTAFAQAKATAEIIISDQEEDEETIDEHAPPKVN